MQEETNVTVQRVNISGENHSLKNIGSWTDLVNTFDMQKNLK